MKNKPATTADYQRRINTVVEYIRTHLDETLDLRTLAEVSSFSPCHFHRIVSAFLGEPPGEFIARTRIETAARLLLYSDLTVAEIAYRVGYDAPSSLTKAFGRFFGISPKEYRTAKNLPSMTKCMHSDAGIRLSKPKMLEIPEKTVAYLRAQGDYGEVDYGDCFARLWQYVEEQKLFSAGIESIVVYHNDPDISKSGDLRCDVCLTIPKGPWPSAPWASRRSPEAAMRCSSIRVLMPDWAAPITKSFGSGCPEAAANCVTAPVSNATAIIPTGCRRKS